MSDAKSHSNFLTPIDDACEQLLASLPGVAAGETVALDQAFGRVLIAECRAQLSMPPRNNSAMDGYAVRSVDTTSTPAVLNVTQRIPAGQVGEALAAGEAARIFTGAPLPSGADAVVMQENTEAGEDQVTVLQAVRPGENVRPAGEDFKAGTVLLPAGHRLRPQDIGLLASAGLVDVEVAVRPRVAILTTGDELVTPGTKLGAGQIYNSNAYTLAALLKSMDLPVFDLGVVADTPQATEQALQEAVASADCIITTGGVSVGEEDHVKAAIEKHGHLDLWKLAIKPGKPFASGKVHGRQFFGLPGNPVSAFVTFVLLVRPALLRMQGCVEVEPRAIPVAAGFDRPQSGARQEYLRVSLQSGASGELVLQPYDNQSSGAGASLSGADGLAIIPPRTSTTAGDMLAYLSFSELLR